MWSCRWRLSPIRCYRARKRLSELALLRASCHGFQPGGYQARKRLSELAHRDLDRRGSDGTSYRARKRPSVLTHAEGTGAYHADAELPGAKAPVQIDAIMAWRQRRLGNPITRRESARPKRLHTRQRPPPTRRRAPPFPAPRAIASNSLCQHALTTTQRRPRVHDPRAVRA